MRKLAFLLCGVALLSASCTRSPEPVIPAEQPFSYDDGVVRLANREVGVEFADTAESRRRGLSGRPGLEDDQGMVFLFDTPAILSFWMPDMRFPIDIIWIRGDKVVGISADVQPEPGVPLNELKTYSPDEPADRVLELPAGWAARNGLKTGDMAEITRVVGN